MSTPVRVQYLRAKGRFPHAILFFRLGDFYEMFDDDARIAARELSVTLTTRAFATDECVPMCGVPYYTVEEHITRLVARGYTIAICEQIGDPRTAKGLVAREVVRVVTPASAVESALLSASVPAEREPDVQDVIDSTAVPPCDGQNGQGATSGQSMRVRASVPGAQRGLVDPRETPSITGSTASPMDGEAVQLEPF